ncbi:MAG TPA: penicillin-binding transpeptidase domain-containing protein [Bacteroidales bacterium]|nr:penicillin-binding transpeptidase domain-containing protein [Bacteroidales bacterium]
MSDKRKSILMRAYLVYVLVIIYALIIIGRIIQIQFVQGDYWKKQASKKNEIIETINPVRGNIYAEDGDLLAVSLPVFQVNINMDTNAIPDEVFHEYVGYLGNYMSMYYDHNVKNKNKYISELTSAHVKHKRNYLLFKETTIYELKKLKSFLKLLKKTQIGLSVTKKYKRVRPVKNQAAMTIGYERLGEYDVKIHLKKLKNQEDAFYKNLDTLSQCFANTFSDLNRDFYKKILLKAYQEKGDGIIAKKIDVLQLEELMNFPLIKDKIPQKTDIIDYVDSLCEEKSGNIRLGIVDIKKLTNSYYVGLEGHYSEILRGKRGFIPKRRVGSNSWVDISDENTVKPINGYNLYTSLDMNLQDVAQSALRKSLDTTRADWGCVVLMEVKTGYIKAIANLTRNEDGTYSEKRNYAYRQLYEPGSTLKLASVIAVLEDGKFDTNTIVNSGRITYDDYGEVVDSHEEGYGNISVGKAFEKSSNVGITQITRRAFLQKSEDKVVTVDGKKKRIKENTQFEKFKKLIKQMGLLNKTGVDLYNETSPDFPVRREDLTAIAFGYSVKLTPLQVLAFYNAVANNGTYMKPKIVKEIRNNSAVYQNNPEIMIRQICSESTINKVKKLLEGVVSRGTARVIRKAPYKIAGKTGTARIYDEELKEYVDRYCASFCGYFPADDPKYSCIVVEHNMRGVNVYGSDVAAPVFKEISDKVYATRVDIKTKEIKMPDTLSAPVLLIGYRKDVENIYGGLNLKLIYGGGNSQWVSVTKDTRRIYEKDKVIKAQRIPDVKGMKAKDAVWMLERAGLKVIVEGTGKVVEQLFTPEKKTVKIKLSL